MALAFDAASFVESDNTDVLFSWAHTCTGSERGLIVVAGTSGEAPLTMTYAGAAMSKIGEQQEPDTGRMVSMWYQIAPATGSNNVSVTFTEGRVAEFRGVSFTGAHQSSMVGTASSAFSLGGVTGTNPSIVVTAAPGDIVIDGLCWNQGDSPADETVGAGQTQRGGAAAGVFARCVSSTEAGAATVTMSWTLSGFGSYWAMIGVAVKPSATGSTITFDAASSTTTNNTGTSLTWQHTTSGTNRALIVGCATTSQSSPTEVTYAGQPMTQVVSRQEPNTGKRISLWKLSNPTLGTNNVTVSFPSAVGGTCGAASFNSCNQTTSSLTNNSGTSVGATSNAVITLVSTATEVMVGIFAGGASLASTRGAASSFMWFDIGNVSGVLTRCTFQSASASTTVNFSISAVTDWAIGAMALVPSVAVAEALSGQTVIAQTPFFDISRFPIVGFGFMCEEGATSTPFMSLEVSMYDLYPMSPTPHAHYAEVYASVIPDDTFAAPSPAVTTGSLGPRVSLPPQMLADEEQWKRQAALWMNEANQGHLQNVGVISLNTDQTSTTVSDSRVGPSSFIGFSPNTANAAAELANGTMFVSSQGKQTFTITHANNAQNDRTFTYSIMG